MWQVPERARDFMDILVKPDGSPFPIDAGQCDQLYRKDGIASNGLPVFVDVTHESGIGGNEFGLSSA